MKFQFMALRNAMYSGSKWLNINKAYVRYSSVDRRLRINASIVLPFHSMRQNTGSL